jgi:lipopolysaccharide assembly outer membrane protein LptD (OstA)
MTTTTSRGPAPAAGRGSARGRMGAVLVLLVLGGCAWFREPLQTAPTTASRPPATSLTPSEAGSTGAFRAGGEIDTTGAPGKAPGAGAPGAEASAGGAEAPETTPAPPESTAAAAPGAPAAAPGAPAAAGTTGVPPGTTAVVAGITPAPPETVAAPPETTTAVPETTSTPEPEALAGPDEWTLTGEPLVATTGPEGQVLHITSPYITHKDLAISAPTGTYQVDAGRAHLIGGVTFTDPETRGTSETATYYRKTGLLVAEGDVRVEVPGDSLVLQGNEGRFDRKTGVMRMIGNARGRRGQRHFTAREMDWYRDRHEIILLGDVRVTEPEEHTTLGGERLIYDLDTDRARVDRRPLLFLTGGSGGPIQIGGERVWLDPGGNASASGSVRVTRGGVKAYSDSAAFFADTHEAFLYGAPRVEEQDGTLTGDTLILRFDADRVLQQADVHGNAQVTYAPRDSVHLGELSIVRGDSLTMYFVDDKADRVVVFDHATSTYVPSPADAAGGAGTNAAQGDTITIFIQAGEIHRVKITGHAKGVYTFGDKGAAEGQTPEERAAEAAAGLGRILGESPDSTGRPHAPPDSTTGGADPDPPVPRAGSRANGDASTAGAPPDTAAGAHPGPGLAAGKPPGTAAPDTAGGTAPEKVVYEAKTVDYSVPDRVVDLLGEAKAIYGDLTLTAGKVRFYTDRRYLEAEDKPVLVEREVAAESRKVVGTRMDYNLRTREGTIRAGQTKAEDGFIYSDALRKIGEEQFLAREGSYTTCDLIEHDEEPHYHFTSKRMRIYLKDKVVAKPVVLYIRDIPVFALPFYVFSIRKGRHSGFLTPNIDFGLGSTQGRSFSNLGYYWAASQYWDLTVSSDYTEYNAQFIGQVEARYAKRYLMDGNLRFGRTLGSGKKLSNFTGAHKMTLGEWQLTGTASFRSATYNDQLPLGGNLADRVDKILQSDLSLSRRFSRASLYLTASRTKNLAAVPGDGKDEQILREDFPRYRFSMSRITLGHPADAEGNGGVRPWLSTVNLSLSSGGASTYTETEKTTILQPGPLSGGTVGGGRDDFERFDAAEPETLYTIDKERTTSAVHTISLSDSRRLLNAFNLQPAVTLNENWVDREFSASDTLMGFHRAAIWNATLGTGTTLYGTFGGIGPVTALRHTFQPAATFTYQPSFLGLTYVDADGNRRNRFPGVGGFERKSMSLSLRNGLQAKVRSGEDVRRINLIQWSLNSSYDFLARKRGTRGWTNVSSTLDIPTVYGVNMSFKSTHDPYRQFRFQNYGFLANFGLGGVLPGAEAGEAVGPETPFRDTGSWQDLGANLGQSALDQVGSSPAANEALRWSATFGFSNSGTRVLDRIQTRTTLNSNASVQITKNWSVTYSSTWDLTAHKVSGETIGLRRDLHCWEAQFTRTQLGTDTSFYFRINAKAMPDVKYEQGRNAGSGLTSITRMLP